MTSSTPRLVIRKNVNELSDHEADRFVKALKLLMKPKKEITGTSEYARIAGYHSYPHTPPYCQHGNESFPSWLRGHMKEMEMALQIADTSLGNDGVIGLPYWDWLDSESQGIPKLIFDHFAEMPEDLVDEDAGDLYTFGYTRIRSNAAIQQRLRRQNVVVDTYDCLDNTYHFRHASASNYHHHASIEQPHTSVHVAVGFPLSSIKYAAFHPLFFLHHCNIDRVYQTFVSVEGADDCRREFEHHQNYREQRRKREHQINYYKAELTPFKHPITKQSLFAKDCFDPATLGYSYDKLLRPQPRRRSVRENERSHYAVFPDLNPNNYVLMSYEVHVFVSSNDRDKLFDGAPLQEDFDLVNYAGSASIFGGGESKRPNCNTSDLFSISVDITAALQNLNLNRDNAKLEVVAEIDSGLFYSLQDAALPEPLIVGPTFSSSDLTQSTSTSHNDEIHRLQALLLRNGVYQGHHDGVFGSDTAEAVLEYQKSFGLKQDGIVGSNTKAQLQQLQYDFLAHTTTTGNKPLVSLARGGRPTLFWVASSPAYLSREELLTEVESAFQIWSESCSLLFEHTTNAEQAHIQIDFAPDLEEQLYSDGNSNSSDTNPNVTRSCDGQGGRLAHASPDGVTIDMAVRWTLHTSPTPRSTDGRTVTLLPVLVHELGHVFGLGHSFDTESVMFPYYNKPKTTTNNTNTTIQVSLSEADKKAISKLHSKGLRHSLSRLSFSMASDTTSSSEPSSHKNAKSKPNTKTTSVCTLL